MNTTAVVALDVGGTLMKGAVVDASGVTLVARRRPTPRAPDTGKLVHGILDFVEHLAGSAGSAPVAVGLAVPGLVDERRGIARYSANLGWRDVPIREIATARLGLPVAVLHDVRSGALAEGLFGAGRDTAEFLFLPIGTGIAGTVFVRGEPYPGASGMAGEIGHAPVQLGDEACACGQRGCLETYASAAALARRYAERGGSTGLSTPDIIERAVAGEDIAAAVWSEALSALAFALATYTMLLDPELVVIGGGLADAGDALFAPLADRLAGRLAWREPPRLVPARLGPAAGCLGAAVAAWRLAGHADAGERWEPT